VDLKRGIDERMPDSLAAYEDAMTKWKTDHAQWEADNPGVASQPMEVDGDKEDEAQPKNSSERRPSSRTRSCTEYLWQLPNRNANSFGKKGFATPFTSTSLWIPRCCDWPTRRGEVGRAASCKAETSFRSELEKTGGKATTDSAARKKVYAKLATYWPEGWMWVALPLPMPS
jgi:hypothetical protein